MYKILIIDDEDEMREFMRLCLEGIDCEIYEASSSEMALVLVESQPQLHLVISDVHMPGMNGLEAIREIRRLRPQLPVILCSNDFELSEETAIFSGAAAFFSKSISNLKRISGEVRAILAKNSLKV